MGKQERQKGEQLFTQTPTATSAAANTWENAAATHGTEEKKTVRTLNTCIQNDARGRM